MEKNIGKVDRAIRFIIGVLLIYPALIINNNALKIILLIIAAISIVESFIGFCGIYKLLKINTNRGW